METLNNLGSIILSVTTGIIGLALVAFGKPSWIAGYYKGIRDEEGLKNWIGWSLMVLAAATFFIGLIPFFQSNIHGMLYLMLLYTIGVFLVLAGCQRYV